MKTNVVNKTKLIDGLRAIGEPFPATLRAFRDSLSRISNNDVDLVNALIKNADGEDAKIVVRAIKSANRLQNLFKRAVAAAHSFESVDGRLHMNRKVEDLNPSRLTEKLEQKAYPINADSVKIVVKVSGVECEMKRLRVSLAELKEIYADKDPETGNALFEAYRQQKLALKEIQRHFKQDQFLTSDELMEDPSLLNKAGAIIAFGGDDHLKFISHFIKSDVPLIGVNSDPKFSFGWLLGYWYTELKELKNALSKGDYKFEPWSRLKIEVDGKELPPTFDLFLGESKRKLMSRHMLSRGENGSIENLGRQKGSGLLITTGAGSTGWFNSEAWPLYPRGTRFGADARYGRFFNTGISGSNGGASERASNQIKLPKNWEGLIYPGQKLVIKSQNRNDGIATTDSIEEFPFTRASTATVSIDPNPIWIILNGAARKDVQSRGK